MVHNGVSGILSSGGGSRVRITDVTVSGNSNGLQSNGAGEILSFGTNKVAGNTTDGAPTGTLGQI